MQSHRFLLLTLVTTVGTIVTLVVAQTGLADFGLNENLLKPRIVNSLIYGNLPGYPNVKHYHAAAPALQAAFVKNALIWAKTYTESPTFKADYDKQRASAKPSAPKSKGTPDEQYAKYLADQRQSVEDMKKNIAKMSPDMQQKMAGTVKQMEENANRTGEDPQMAAMMKQSFARQAEADQKNYQDQLASYDKKYPADPKFLIASRLREFLDLSTDIPFDARLVPGGGGKMKLPIRSQIGQLETVLSGGQGAGGGCPRLCPGVAAPDRTTLKSSQALLPQRRFGLPRQQRGRHGRSLQHDRTMGCAHRQRHRL